MKYSLLKSAIDTKNKAFEEYKNIIKEKVISAKKGSITPEIYSISENEVCIAVYNYTSRDGLNMSKDCLGFMYMAYDKDTKFDIRGRVDGYVLDYFISLNKVFDDVFERGANETTNSKKS
jgi:hypothetical protein